MEPQVTVLTPTTGKPSLRRLIESVKSQNVPCVHITLWDQKKYSGEDVVYSWNRCVEFPITIEAATVKGQAYGSALRAVGLMAAQTEYVTFADDDVVWLPDHLENMLKAIKDANWAITKREIWCPSTDGNSEYLGVDDFESVGEEAKTPYKMVDNNCMMFKRRFGTSAAVLYRETTEYNDDRLFYNFMMKHAGKYGKTNKATIQQTCPERLIEFFRNNCTK